MTLAPRLVAIGALLACWGCDRAATRGAEAKRALADARPDARAAAAAELRKLDAEQPEAIGDHGRAHWEHVLSGIATGSPSSTVADVTGSTPGSYATEGPGAVGFRLDDFWEVIADLDRDQRITRFEPLVRAPLVVDTPRWPDNYGGLWFTYRVSGSVYSEATLQAGKVSRYRCFHDNDRLWSDEHYRDGKLEGQTDSFHENGKQAYERHYSAGIQVGPAREWHDNGKLWIQSTYVAGKLDGPQTHFRANGTKEVLLIYSAGEEKGQAAWDDTGQLLYARGAAEATVRDSK